MAYRLCERMERNLWKCWRCFQKQSSIRRSDVILILIVILLHTNVRFISAYHTSSEQDITISSTTTEATAGQAIATVNTDQDTDIREAIEKFESSSSSAAGRGSNESSDTNHPSSSSELTNSNVHRPATLARQNAQARRKLIRSRYRLRSTNNDMLNGQQLVAASNYSQPFDGSPVSMGQDYQQQQQQHSLARALPVGGVTQVGGGSMQSQAGADSTAPYAYLSGPSQRASVHHHPAIGGGGARESGSSAFLDEPSSLYSVAELNALEYTPPLQQGYNPTLARMYPSSANRMRSSPAASASELSLPYYLASPSTINYGDYYGGNGGSGSLASGSMNEYSPSEQDNYYGTSSLMKNFSSDHLGFGVGASPYASSTSSLFQPDIAHSSFGSARSRWSWPWADISAMGNPMTAATFKKHHHHHHHHEPTLHKEHDHHHHHEDQNDHMMSKWEHGISIGEIACVAIAVVLGVIILGSPFFLLFLMLFNGGNLFGATQMGLLAPAAVPAGAASGAGRRRKRSIATGKQQQTDSMQEQVNKLKKSLHLGDHLFERLSPFLNTDNLMRSFERIMEVKDDIEKLVGKLNAKVNFDTTANEHSHQQHHQHSEM